MKDKNLVVSIVLAVLFNLLIKPAWVLTENGVQANMGNDYGLYAALLSLAALWNICSDLGLNQWLTRTFANHPEKYQDELPGISGAKFWLSIFYIPSLAIIGLIFGYRIEEIYFLLILGLYQICISWTQLFRANLQAFQHFRWDGFIGIIDKVFLLVFVLIFSNYSSDIQGFAILTLISGVLAAASGFFANQFLIGNFPVRFSPKQILPLLKLSIPFAIMALLFTANERLNQVMLERISGKEESSIYAAAFRWTSAISMFLWVVLPVFFARFAKIKENELEQLQKLFKLGWTLVALPTLFITGWVVFYGDVLLFQFSNVPHEKRMYIFYVLQILIFTVFLNGCFNVFSTYLTATHREKQVNVVLGIALASNIILNFISIPVYGAAGTAFATVFAFILQSIGFVVLFKKFAPIAVPWPDLIKFFIVGILYFYLLYLLKNEVNFIFGAMITGLFLLLSSLFSGLIHLKMFTNK